MFSNRVICSGILATLFLRWDAIAANLPTCFHQFIKLVAGGSLPPETRKPPKKGGLMIPFTIFDLMVPIGAGISTFWKRLPGSHQARSHRATLHDYLWTQLYHNKLLRQ